MHPTTAAAAVRELVSAWRAHTWHYADLAPTPELVRLRAWPRVAGRVCPFDLSVAAGDVAATLAAIPLAALLATRDTPVLILDDPAPIRPHHLAAARAARAAVGL